VNLWIFLPELVTEGLGSRKLRGHDVITIATIPREAAPAAQHGEQNRRAVESFSAGSA
jgi:hypothetical protein